MTDTQTTPPTIQQAVRALAARCDGAHMQDGMGFNGRDTNFGRSLASQRGDNWTLKQLQAARRMLTTYRTQLAGMGIDLDQVRTPEAEAELRRPAASAKPAVAGVARQDPARADRLLLQFPYDAALVAGLKAAGLKAFNDGNGWTWPVPHAKVPDVMHLLANFDGSELVLEVAADQLAMREVQAGNVEASRAASGPEVEVEGLGGSLLPFQHAGVAYMVANERAIVADEMGLGKTVEALAATQRVRGYPALFVVPASLKLNWLAEATKWLPGRRFEVLDGRDAVPSGTADAYIVNYELVRAEESTVGTRKVLKPTGLAARLAKLGLKSITCDEAHRIKDKKALQSKGVKALAQGLRYRWLLTGTPVKNRPVEITHLLDVLGRLNEDFGGFMKFALRYCAARRERFGWNFKGSSNLPELNERLRAVGYVRRLKAEVLKELPPLRQTRVVLPIDNAEEYKRAEDDFLAWLAANAGTEAARRASRAEQLVRVNGLRQLAVKGKLKAVQAWVEDGFTEQERKLVLFAHHLSAQTLLRDAFQAPAIRGDMSREEIEADKARFTKGDAGVIVCSLLAGGVGHTLHADGACSDVALGELGWSPADVEQAAARVHRIGQTASSVNAWWLLGAGTIDMDMADMLDGKLAVCVAAAGDDRARLSAESVEDAVLAKFLARAGVAPDANEQRGEAHHARRMEADKS